MNIKFIYLFIIFIFNFICFYSIILTEEEKKEFTSIGQFFESLIPKEVNNQRPKTYGRVSSLSQIDFKNPPKTPCIKTIEYMRGTKLITQCLFELIDLCSVEVLIEKKEIKNTNLNKFNIIKKFMPKLHFVEEEENFGVKLGRILWSTNDKNISNFLIHNENLFLILKKIETKIGEWESFINENKLEEINLNFPPQLNVFEIIDGLIYGGKGINSEVSEELEKFVGKKEIILILYNKIYNSALNIIKFIFKEKNNFEEYMQSGSFIIQRQREGEYYQEKYEAIEKSAKESFNLYKELAFEFEKKHTNSVEHSNEIIEKTFLKVKSGLMRFWFNNGIKKQFVINLIKWNENEQAQILFQQLNEDFANIVKIFDNLKKLIVHIANLFTFYYKYIEQENSNNNIGPSNID